MALRVAALGCCVALAACGGGSRARTGPPSDGFAGAALPVAVAAPPFTLTGVHGERISLRDQRGQVVVLAFVHSGCRACVLVAQQVRGALDQLAHPATVLLVSVDPARETPARVRAFLRRVSLAGRVRYLTGPRSSLAAVWRDYRVRTPQTSPTDFEQALTVVLIDRAGRERVLYGLEQLSPEALSHDIGILQRG